MKGKRKRQNSSPVLSREMLLARVREEIELRPGLTLEAELPKDYADYLVRYEKEQPLAISRLSESGAIDADIIQWIASVQKPVTEKDYASYRATQPITVHLDTPAGRIMWLVGLDFEDQFGVGQAQPVAHGGAEHFGIGASSNGCHGGAPLERFTMVLIAACAYPISARG